MRAVISFVDLVFPQILRNVDEDSVCRKFCKDSVWFIADKGLLFLLYFLQTGCKYYVSYQGHMMGARMERDMRQQLV